MSTSTPTTHPAASRIGLVAFGGSAGSLQSLTGILPQLCLDVPVVVVVHVGATSSGGLAQSFAHRCKMHAREAFDKQRSRAGSIYFAPAEYHLLIESNRHFALSTEPKVRHNRPSIDVFLESASNVFGPELLVVILSGANDDGALGCRHVQERGGRIAVQEPESCEFSTMPHAVLGLTRPDFIGNPAELLRFVSSLPTTRHDASADDQAPPGR